MRLSSRKDKNTNLSLKVKEYILENNMIIRGERVALAVSGGADSVAMLLIFNELKDDFGIDISVRHLDHCIRGEESQKDAEFVEKLCKDLGVSFFTEKKDVPSFAKNKGLSLEEAARILRYEFLLSGKEDSLALAHNAGDNAETVLFNLVRGTGLNGLCGISPLSKRQGKKLIRPLLFAKREEILSYLKEKKQDFRTDSSNLSCDYDRNKIRNQILPILSEINEKAIDHINQAAGVISGLNEYEKENIKAYLKKNSDKNTLKTKDLESFPGFLKKALFLEWIKTRGKGTKDIGSAHLFSMEKLIGGQVGKTIDIPGFIVEKTHDGLSLKEPGCEKEAKKIPLYMEIPKGDIGKVPYHIETNGYVFSIKAFDRDNTLNIPGENYTKWFDYDKIDPVFVLTYGEKGDFFSIKGQEKLSGKKLLRRLLIDEKIPANKRDIVLTFKCKDHIMWAPLFPGRLSEYFKVTENTKRILEITAKEKNDG